MAPIALHDRPFKSGGGSSSSSASSFTLPPKSAATLASRPAVVAQALCLLCASSPPSAAAARSSLIETKCCGRSICGTCIGEKGRAARWDPCLFCSSRPRSSGTGGDKDGGPFVLGDDEDEDDVVANGQVDPEKGGARAGEQATEADLDASPAEEQPAPGSAIRHIVRKGDTLIGISLKYGVDPHHLCTLNRLPQSTIHTTPHLLQTRSYILLLPSPPPPLPASVQTQIAHERAIARFGKVTKEEDPLVRRAYVGLAELNRDGAHDRNGGHDRPSMSGEKEKRGKDAGTIEDRAIGVFFEDRQWEAANGGPRIPSFPLAGPSSSSLCPSSHRQPVADSTPFDWAFGWGNRSQRSTGGFLKLG